MRNAGVLPSQGDIIDLSGSLERRRSVSWATPIYSGPSFTLSWQGTGSQQAMAQVRFTVLTKI